MEDLRVVKLLMILAAALAVLLLCAPGVLAYNNVGSHPTINQMAYGSFVNYYMSDDPYLKMASLNGGQTNGLAWDPQDGTSNHQRITEPVRTKTIAQWISDAGFSADEPEIDMALKHFYDPIRYPQYLTDWVNDFPGGDGYVNPHEDAFEWAFTDSDNTYGFENGENYYRTALADTDPGTLDYGKAWRSVGETMHLISDMTVPAHVRNDAHIPYLNYWDPYEFITTALDVDMYGSMNYPASTLDYHAAYAELGDDNIRALFHKVATFTNANFFSRDTTPLYGDTVSYNDELQYPSPTVTWDKSFTGYITSVVDGRTLNLTRQSLVGRLWKEPYLVIDQTVCNDQRSILIPTAIASSAAVLDAFLPRFSVIIDSVLPDPDNEGDYLVSAHIRHIPTIEWPDDLTIRNGAYISLDSEDFLISMDYNMASSDNLNTIRVGITADEGTVIQIYYDLGGYRIYSDKYVIPITSPTPTPKATNVPTKVPTKAPTAAPSQQPATGVSEDWLNGNYINNFLSFWPGTNDPYQVWYHHPNDDGEWYMVYYFQDGKTVNQVYYMTDYGITRWKKTYSDGGTLLYYVEYNPDGTVISSQGSDPAGNDYNSNPVMP
jgi:hypothetical protein